MAKTVKLSNELLGKIADDAANVFAAAGIEFSKEDNPEIGESFALWSLPASAAIDNDPLKSAVPTGKFHHQIYRRGRPNVFVYSQPFGLSPADWRVVAAFESEIPAAIDKAIDVVDNKIEMEGEVRLLVIPGYHLHALWVITAKHENFIVLAAFPAEYKKKIKVRVNSASEFFKVLGKLHPIAASDKIP